MSPSRKVGTRMWETRRRAWGKMKRSLRGLREGNGEVGRGMGGLRRHGNGRSQKEEKGEAERSQDSARGQRLSHGLRAEVLLPRDMVRPDEVARVVVAQGRRSFQPTSTLQRVFLHTLHTAQFMTAGTHTVHHKYLVRCRSAAFATLCLLRYLDLRNGKLIPRKLSTYTFSFGPCPANHAVGSALQFIPPLVPLFLSLPRSLPSRPPPTSFNLLQPSQFECHCNYEMTWSSG
jgi:hypothetical protein